MPLLELLRSRYTCLHGHRHARREHHRAVPSGAAAEELPRPAADCESRQTPPGVLLAEAPSGPQEFLHEPRPQFGGGHQPRRAASLPAASWSFPDAAPLACYRQCDMAAPLRVLIEGTRRSPVLRLAWAVLGASSVVAVVAAWGLDLRVALLGTVVVIGLMAAMSGLSLALSSFDQASSEVPARLRSLSVAASILIWGFSLLVVATGTFLITSYFFAWPRALFVESPGTEVDKLVQAMWASMDGRELDSAFANAKKVLALDPENPEAFNCLGEIAFYRGDYFRAAENFEDSLRVRPGRDIILSNLGDTYVELGRYQDAIHAYEGMKVRGADWAYELGRAYIYDGDVNKGLALVEPVSTSEYRGRARVLEAAGLVKLANQFRGKQKSTTITKAREALRLGVGRDPRYWREKLVEGERDIHEGFAVTREILGDLVREVIN